MAEAAHQLKANPKLAGQACGWCAETIALGDDLKQCNDCQTVHHGRCWDGAAGCSKVGCVNAPLKRLDDAAPVAAAAGVAAAVPPGYMLCPACKKPVMDTEGLCGYCNAILSPDGIYHGPQVNAPGAVQSLVWALVGLVICGVIAGPIAIGKSREASKAIAASPRYKGQGLATAGLVIGIIDIIGWILVIFARVSQR
jgi:hypothetical protein